MKVTALRRVVDRVVVFLLLRAVNSKYIAVEWMKPRSFGDAAVAAYKVYVNGVVEASLGADQLSFSFTKGVACREYVFQVQVSPGSHSRDHHGVLKTVRLFAFSHRQKNSDSENAVFYYCKIQWKIIFCSNITIIGLAHVGKTSKKIFVHYNTGRIMGAMNRRKSSMQFF